MHKNNSRTHSPQQNKKAALTTAAYFKISTPVRSQGQWLLFVYLRSPKRLPLVNKKSEHYHWIQHIRISLGTKFQLKLKIFILQTIFAQKGCFRSKTGKIEHHHCILRIRISLGIKFQLTLTVVIFFFFFFDQTCAKKGCFWSKVEKYHLCVRPWSLLTILNFSVRRSTDTTVF